jgi:lipopolysaccharide transport system ATP-binding protein
MTAIRINKLSKSYVLRHETEKRATNLGEALIQKLSNPFQRMNKEKFWALKDMNVEIEEGEVVGVIGRNGAGKSTFLKILSRIVEPTTGRVEMFGRVGALLEVGTGFHPELSGRENIYLNGAILGMRRLEISRQFDHIVDFAGVEKFLDTPVKRYSSGMYVRLAFAVAAHLNPEILIIDEVLAVGDADFQRKCLGKMKSVAESGRTVLFVSHNLQAIRMLCTSILVLEGGRTKYHGDVSTGIDLYENTTSSNVSCGFHERSDVPVYFRQISIDSLQGRNGVLDVVFPIVITIEFEVLIPVKRLEASARLESSIGYVGTIFSSFGGASLDNLSVGKHRLSMTFSNPDLIPANYQWSFWLHDPMRELFDYKESVIGTVLTNSNLDCTGLGNLTTIGPILLRAESTVTSI